ncbi:hypothetical protein IQ16_02935 [Bradyrhizobium huanghuaihaiense]|uniref:Helix-turn-helix protein n=1 Tax=Bradyrhizobium huanghuaihaiense TaxID=990078 RepID=A0A562RSH1_9BRAD|nr:hypothetical protein IQ16_02935 [Bradyrhizobium huanghuaihaiense]
MARREVTGRGPSVTAAPRVELASGPPLPNEKTSAPPVEPKRVKRAVLPPVRGPPIAPMAYSIRQFCEAHNISVDTYFRMQRVGFGPVTMKVGGRTLISVEAAAAWRREREAETSTRTVAAE